MNSMKTAVNQNGANSILYYPYAFIVPEKAMAGRIDLSREVAMDALLLEQEGILERISPEEILAPP